MIFLHIFLLHFFPVDIFPGEESLCMYLLIYFPLQKAIEMSFVFCFESEGTTVLDVFVIEFPQNARRRGTCKAKRTNVHTTHGLIG